MKCPILSFWDFRSVYVNVYSIPKSNSFRNWMCNCKITIKNKLRICTFSNNNSLCKWHIFVKFIIFQIFTVNIDVFFVRNMIYVHIFTLFCLKTDTITYYRGDYIVALGRTCDGFVERYAHGPIIYTCIHASHIYGHFLYGSYMVHQLRNGDNRCRPFKHINFFWLI